MWVTDPDRGADESRCYDLLRRCRWPQGPVCVRCGAADVAVHVRCAETPRLKYRCRRCRHTFTDLTGTCFARSKLPLRVWFGALDLLDEHPDPVECARRLGVKWDTAHRLIVLLERSAARPGLVRALKSALRGKAVGS